MKSSNLVNFKGGWIIGNFIPSIIKSDDFEVAIKYYCAGDKEEAHCHKLATEFTIVTHGVVAMNGTLFRAGDIVVVEPGEYADFHSLENSITVVIKTPSIPGDKFFKK